MPGAVLLTGGCGYIGSHVAVQLLEAGEDVVLFDNLCNSHAGVVGRIAAICGRAPAFVEGDIRDRSALDRVLASRRFGAVIHLAGLKSVDEGEARPQDYHDTNVEGSRTLLDAMEHAGVHTLVFSSSATVYGMPPPFAAASCREDMPLDPVNVYGHTKKAVEDMLRARQQALPAWRVAVLRYFNPAGAHPSGLIGEAPLKDCANLMPQLAQVALGRRDALRILGNDYPTPDGTGLRDYIHIEDIAAGHIAALAALQRGERSITVNLGSGRAHSVLEVIAAYEKASGRSIPHEIAPRRPGDLPAYHADPALAWKLLRWQARHDIARICEDAWRWELVRTGINFPAAKQ